MRTTRKNVVERYKKACELYKTTDNISWYDCLKKFGLGRCYPYIDLECYKLPDKGIDSLVSDLIGMVIRCKNKNTDFLNYCKRVVVNYDLLSNSQLIKPMDLAMRKISHQIDIDFMTDAEVIEQVRKRGLYIGPDGKYHKKQIVETIIDIE